MSSSSRRTAASSPAVFLASAMPCSHCLARAPSSMPRSWPAGKIACPTSEHSTPRQLQPGEPLRLVLRSNGVQWGRSATTSADRTEAEARAAAAPAQSSLCPLLRSLQERRAAPCRVSSSRPRRHCLEEEAGAVQIGQVRLDQGEVCTVEGRKQKSGRAVCPLI